MCWDEAQWSVAECLTTVYKVLGSIPTTAPRKRNKDTEEIKALDNGTDNRHRALDSTACCRWLLRDASLGFSSDWQRVTLLAALTKCQRKSTSRKIGLSGFAVWRHRTI